MIRNVSLASYGEILIYYNVIKYIPENITIDNDI